VSESNASSARGNSTLRAYELPPIAEWTGYLGVIPFVAALAGVALGPDFAWQHFALRAAVAYGAVILAFVGAAHFGFAVARHLDWSWATVLGSILPSLAGAAAILIGGQRGVGLLVVAFGLFWLYETRVCGSRLPAAYLSLRRNLSMVVCAVLAVMMIMADSVGLR
jgi:hypothetical protein